MRITLFMAVVASVMLSAPSCSKDQTQDEPLTPKPPQIEVPSEPLETLVAEAEQQDDADNDAPKQAPESRTTLSGASVIWTAGEQIRVFTKTNTALNTVYTLKTGAGTASGTFEGTALPGSKYAFYPLTSYTGVSGSTVSFTLPAAQTYRTASFSDSANPMIGQSDAQSVIQFKHLCGAIKLKLTGTATITRIVMTAAAGKVAGAGTVDASAATPAPVFTDAASKTVILTVPNVTLSGSTATSFYLVVPGGSYPAGTTFAISDSDGYTMTLTTKAAITVNRARVAPLKQLAYTRTIAVPDANLRNVLNKNYGLKLTADGTDININDADNQTKFSTTATIDCSGQNIASLQGIEKFTGLTTLNCGTNKLTTLSLSTNTKLTTLNCSNNQLTALNTTPLTALTRLECHQNQITALSLSANTKLTALLAHANRLSTLDVSAAASLNMGSVSTFSVGSQTSDGTTARTLTLKTSAAQMLGWVTNELYADATYNKGITVDQSGTTLFTDAKFRTYLGTLGFTLTSTDVDINNAANLALFKTRTVIDCNTQGISSIKGIEFFKALTKLHCYGNTITSFDISKNTLLLELYCGSETTSLNLSSNTLLQILRCPGYKQSSINLSKNTALTYLDISQGKKLTSIDLANNTKLVTLMVSGGQLSTLDIRKLPLLNFLVCTFGSQYNSDGTPGKVMKLELNAAQSAGLNTAIATNPTLNQNITPVVDN